MALRLSHIWREDYLTGLTKLSVEMNRQYFGRISASVIFPSFSVAEEVDKNRLQSDRSQKPSFLDTYAEEHSCALKWNSL